MTSWGATQAQAQFDAVLDKAETEGPQLLERRDKRFVLMTEEEWRAAPCVEGMPATSTPISSTVEAEPKNDGKPFVSAWDLLRPPPEELADYDFPKLPGGHRDVDL